MATIQPVYGPDYQKILLQGLQTYSTIKGMQRADAQEERAALQQQQNTDREVRINELSTRALTDPQAMAQLQLIAPQKWTQIQEAKKYQREEETYQQQQEEKDAVEAQKAIDRMHEERANLWKSAKGKPLFMQKELIKEHVQRINDRGGDATQSQNLLNMLNSDDPAKIKEAQQVFDSGGQESEKQLLRSRQAKEGGLTPGSEDYNRFMLTGDASFLYPEKTEDVPADKVTPLQKKINQRKQISEALGAGMNSKQVNKVMGLTKGVDDETIALVTQMEQEKDFIKDPQKKGDFELKTQKQYAGLTGGYRSMQASNRNIQSIDPEIDDGPQDIALITGYMKMIDEGSTVREAEFSTALKAGGAWEAAKALLPKLTKGAFLGEETRRKFKAQAARMFKERQKIQKNIDKSYNNIIDTYGLNRENVMFGTPEGQPAATTETTKQPEVIPPTQSEMDILLQAGQ